MYKDINNLIMYRELGEDSILKNISDIIRDFEHGKDSDEGLINRIYREIRRLLSLGTDYGFDKNLWHDYIAYVIVTNENPFSLTAECLQLEAGSVGGIVLNDMKIFNKVFDYDFSDIEKELHINCFSTITNYKAIPKRAQLFNKNVSSKIRKLSDDIDVLLSESNYQASDDAELMAAEGTLKLVTSFYQRYGVGALGLNEVFRVSDDNVLYDLDKTSGNEVFNPGITRVADSIMLSGGVLLRSISNTDEVKLDNLVGYEIQKSKLRENTEAFLEGKPANNVLLYGDAGTGKSTSIKALINEYS
ncbi:MAG TPA: AAA family ATPase, partial [Lachnospiraceae bacterium]|nr:AAA family ATPase [Lachnospiraceae bacterium]